MQIIQLNTKTALAFGMSWSTTDALSRADQLRRAYRDGGRYMASFAGVKAGKGARASDDNFGYAKEFKAPKGVKTYSAAGQLGVHPKWRGATILVVIEEPAEINPNGMIAIVGLLRGNVIVDAIASRGDAGRLIDTYRQRCMQANAEYRQIGSPGAGVAEAFDWGDFIAPAPGRFKSRALVKIQPLKPGNKLAWVGAGALVGAAGFAVYFVIDQQAQDAKRLSEARAREQDDPAYQYQQSSQRLLTTPTLRANTSLREIRNAIKDMPVLLAGWKLNAITCGITGCRVTWKRNEGTYAEFDALAWPEWRPLTLSDDLNTISHSIPLRLVGTALPARSTWPKKVDFLRSETSRWQRLTDKSIGLNITLSADEVMALPPGKDARQFANVPDLIYGAKWAISSSPWWTGELFDTSPDNMTVESVKVEFDGKQMQYTTNGIVYVQK